MPESIDDIAETPIYNETPDPYIYLKSFEIVGTYEIGGENILGATFPLSGDIMINEQVNSTDIGEILEHEIIHLKFDRAWYNKLDERDVRQMTKNNRETRGVTSRYHNVDYSSSAHLY